MINIDNFKSDIEIVTTQIYHNMAGIFHQSSKQELSFLSLMLGMSAAYKAVEDSNDTSTGEDAKIARQIIEGILYSKIESIEARDYQTTPTKAVWVVQENYHLIKELFPTAVMTSLDDSGFPIEANAMGSFGVVIEIRGYPHIVREKEYLLLTPTGDIECGTFFGLNNFEMVGYCQEPVPETMPESSYFSLSVKADVKHRIFIDRLSELSNEELMTVIYNAANNIFMSVDMKNAIVELAIMCAILRMRYDN